MTAPRPSIFSSCSDHCWRVRCCSVMRLVLWHEVQAAFTLGCMGPRGRGLPGALGACALVRITDATRKLAGYIRWNKLNPLSVLTNRMCFVVCGCYFFALFCDCEFDWRG